MHFSLVFKFIIEIFYISWVKMCPTTWKQAMLVKRASVGCGSYKTLIV